MSIPAPLERALLLEQNKDMRVEAVAGRIYVVHVLQHLTFDVMAAALKVIWASPGWRQPWGLVIAMGGSTYDGDIRKHSVPPDHQRAVGTAIFTTNPMHRVVIKAIGIGYSMVSRFVLTSHETLASAIAKQREEVQKAELERRPF
jgi:hypothetical protein